MSLPSDYTSDGIPVGLTNTIDPVFFAWALQTLVVSNSPIIGLYAYANGTYTLVQTINANCTVSINNGVVTLVCNGSDSSSASYTFNTVVLLVPQFTFGSNTVSWIQLYGTGNSLNNYTKSSTQTVQVSLQMSITVPVS
jgi:hypothetical protein